MGFSRSLLSKYVKEGLLERSQHGVYMLTDTIEDDMYMLMIRSRNRLDDETVVAAIKNYVNSREKDLNLLAEYAELYV